MTATNRLNGLEGTSSADWPMDPAERARQFKKLTERWKRETGMLSSFTKKINHPAYLKIIEMGMPVVPLILKEMRERPAYWFAALESITKTSPIEEGVKADLSQATDAWLTWGRKAGLVE